jgi:hypothetical protein
MPTEPARRPEDVPAHLKKQRHLHTVEGRESGLCCESCHRDPPLSRQPINTAVCPIASQRVLQPGRAWRGSHLGRSRETCPARSPGRFGLQGPGPGPVRTSDATRLGALGRSESRICRPAILDPIGRGSHDRIRVSAEVRTGTAITVTSVDAASSALPLLHCPFYTANLLHCVSLPAGGGTTRPLRARLLPAQPFLAQTAADRLQVSAREHSLASEATDNEASKCGVGGYYAAGVVGAPSASDEK